MKRQFYLHRVNAPMCADSVVYHVWAGESVREQIQLSKLMSWAFQSGATLRSWSEEIDHYLWYEAERVFTEVGLLNFGFSRADLTVSEALSLALTDQWQAFEKSLTLPKNLISMLSVLDPISVDRKKSSIRRSPILSLPRQNLSQSGEPDRSIISFT